MLKTSDIFPRPSKIYSWLSCAVRDDFRRSDCVSKADVDYVAQTDVAISSVFIRAMTKIRTPSTDYELPAHGCVKWSWYCLPGRQLTTFDVKESLGGYSSCHLRWVMIEK